MENERAAACFHALSAGIYHQINSVPLIPGEMLTCFNFFLGQVWDKEKVDSNSALSVGWIRSSTVKPNACFQILICGAVANTMVRWLKNYGMILCRIVFCPFID